MIFPGEVWRRKAQPQYNFKIISVGFKIDLCPKGYLGGENHPYLLVVHHQYGYHYMHHMELFANRVR